MLIEKYRQSVSKWIEDGYKFKRDTEGRCLMYLEGKPPIQITMQSYYFALRAHPKIV